MSSAAPVAPMPIEVRWTRRRAIGGLLVLALLFVVGRLPSILREPGWQDEECYAVPGLTILESGIPRLPHLPSRNPASPYYRADEAVFLEPPLFFYWQAVFYAVLPDTYATARLASATGGVLLLLLTGLLALRCGATPQAAWWGIGLFLMSRWFYFNATAARPDTLCAAWGLMAILATESWTRDRRTRWLLAAGIAIGLGGMTHPFALVYAVQMAGWTFLAARGRQRLLAPLTLAITALGVAALWLRLIAQYPETFEVQFRNQFLHDKGGGLVERMVWPWPSIAFHVRFLWPHLDWWQFLLACVGALACLAFGFRENRPLLAKVGWLAITGAWLLCSLVGAHHPVFGYFSYPSALAFIGVGWGIDRVVRSVTSQGRAGRVAAIVLGIACVGSMIPGSRVRMTLAYLRNWNDIHFNAPAFARNLLERLPPDATYLVDEEFALDFVRAGRRTIAFRAIVEGAVPPSTPYDYRIASRSTERYFEHLRWNDELQWTAGIPSDPYGCFAKVYRRRP